MQIKLLPVPAFSDNYIWLWWITGSDKAWVVDPAEAPPVIAALAAHKLQLAGIMVTHHHFDHVGGIPDLLKHSTVPVYGPVDSPATEHITQAVQEGDQLSLGGLDWAVIAVPGHTLDHIAYHSAQTDTLFCGDTLFSAGCGRVFEGTMPQMFHSLQKLATLPDATRVCCAHEYTLSNLRFAAAVEPENIDILSAQTHDEALRAQNLPTLPSTLQRERLINPFLRASTAELFAERRSWKDRF